MTGCLSICLLMDTLNVFWITLLQWTWQFRKWGCSITYKNIVLFFYTSGNPLIICIEFMILHCYWQYMSFLFSTFLITLVVFCVSDNKYLKKSLVVMWNKCLSMCLLFHFWKSVYWSVFAVLSYNLSFFYYKICFLFWDLNVCSKECA